MSELRPPLRAGETIPYLRQELGKVEHEVEILRAHLDPDTESLADVVLRLEAERDHWHQMYHQENLAFNGEANGKLVLKEQLADAKAEIKAGDKLIAMYQGFFADYPCPVHGECIPHVRKLIEDLQQRIEAALALHYDMEIGKGYSTQSSHICGECEAEWPCPTVKALQGEPAPQGWEEPLTKALQGGSDAESGNERQSRGVGDTEASGDAGV